MSELAYAYAITKVVQDFPPQLEFPPGYEPPFAAGDLIIREEPSLQVIVHPDGPITTTASIHRIARGAVQDDGTKFSEEAVAVMEMIARNQKFGELAAAAKRELIGKVQELVEEWGHLNRSLGDVSGLLTKIGKL